MQRANIVHDHIHVACCQTVNRGHVAVWPVMTSHTIHDGKVKRLITMVAGLVNDVHKGRSNAIAPSRVDTVTRGTIGLECPGTDLLLASQGVRQRDGDCAEFCA